MGLAEAPDRLREGERGREEGGRTYCVAGTEDGVAMGDEAGREEGHGWGEERDEERYLTCVAVDSTASMLDELYLRCAQSATRTAMAHSPQRHFTCSFYWTSLHLPQNVKIRKCRPRVWHGAQLDPQRK